MAGLRARSMGVPVFLGINTQNGALRKKSVGQRQAEVESQLGLSYSNKTFLYAGIL